MPSHSIILVPHNGGTWRPADLLTQYPSRLEPGRWKVTVRYTVEPGATYQRTLGRRLPGCDDAPPGWTDPAH
jgi:hypothetical protein